MAAIAENADSLATDTQWAWACRQWLAEWVSKEPYGEKHGKRIEHARSLPVVPVDGTEGSRCRPTTACSGRAAMRACSRALPPLIRSHVGTKQTCEIRVAAAVY